MRFYKTATKNRSTYTYEFTNGDGKQSTFTIKPGENGVTEVDIKMLHYKDDYEIEQNIENHRIEKNFPWFKSLDEIIEKNFDETIVLSSTYNKSSQEDALAVKEHIHLIFQNLSSKKKEVYKRVLINGESKTNVAEDLGISDARVCQIVNEIKKILKNDEFLKKFFIKTSESAKNDCL